MVVIAILSILVYLAIGAVVAGLGERYLYWAFDQADRGIVCVLWPCLVIIGPFLFLARKISGNIS